MELIHLNVLEEAQKANVKKLIESLSKSEKLYFEIADMVKITDLKRNLNYQSSERCKINNDLKQILVLLGIEVSMVTAEKNLLYTNGYKIARELADFDYKKRIEKCIAQDNLCLDYCDQIISDKNQPIDLLEKVTNIQTAILLKIVNLNTVARKIKHNVQKPSKIIKLKNAR